MNTTGRQDAEQTGIQSLLEQYLASRASLKSSVGETSFHLDEDLLSAFTEGSLSERESVPVVRHLVDCGFCRHRTAELVMLDMELAESEEISIPSTTEPSSISKVLSEIMSRIFGGEQAVFAHSEKDEDESKSSSEKD